MAKLLKLRRGSTSQHASFTGAEGEVTIDTTKDTAVVHDGAQAGGRPLAREDMSNVSSASIAGQLGTDSIAVGKIAAGTLPSDVKVNNNNIIDLSIANADVSNSAAIAGTKISPDFGSQNITTTGNVTSGNSLTISGTSPRLAITDTNNNSDFRILCEGGVFQIEDTTNSNDDRLSIASNGTVNIPGNLDIGSGVDVTGNITTTSGNLTVDGRGSVEDSFKITDTAGTQYLLMGNQDSAGANSPKVFAVGNANLTIGVGDNWSNNTGGTLTSQFGISKNGTITSYGNHDFNSGIDVTSGNITLPDAGEVRLGNSGDLQLYHDGSESYINDTGQGSLRIVTDSLQIRNANNTANRLTVASSDGQVNIPNNLDVGAGVDVTGNITVTGTVDGRDVSADGSKLDGMEAYATADQTGTEIATALKGQTIGSSTDGVHDIYNDDWFRNNNSGEGIYNQSTAQHFYSEDAVYWTVAGGANNGIKFRVGHNGTTKGAVYVNNSNQIGFLNNGLNWSFKVDSSGNAEHYGSVTVNSGDNSSDIYMADADETQRRIHCNSHRIGFLRSNNNWGFYCDNDGNVTAANNVTAYSDARLKTNVNTINDALSIVGKLRGVSFDWKADGKHSIGVIAQEVEEVLPELVTTSEGVNPATQEIEEIKSVDYGKMVGVLINAINELKAEIEELKGGK